MNSTMADGASERLDAQVADALFGQPGMSKLDVTNRLRQLRGSGAPLLADVGNPVSPSPADLGDAPFVFSDLAKANALEAGQYAFTEADGEDLGYTACIEACVDAICRVLELPEHRVDLAARQPVGQEPVDIEAALTAGDPNWQAHCRPNLIGSERLFFAVRDIAEMRAFMAGEKKPLPGSRLAVVRVNPNAPGVVPFQCAHRLLGAAYQAGTEGVGFVDQSEELFVAMTAQGKRDRMSVVYAAPPAQTVDLVRARDSIQGLLNWIDDWAETPEESGLDPIAERALELVAQIDAQVYACEPNSEPNRLTDPAETVGHGTGIEAISAERERQMRAEGFTRESDQQYRRGELARAATAYVQLAAMDLHAGTRSHIVFQEPPFAWPWASDWWKPADARRDLVRAGALIAAQIDLIDSQAVRNG